MFIQSFAFVLSAVVLRIKKLFGRMIFAYERRSFVRANRRIDLSQKVVNIPDEFGGGCLYMDEKASFSSFVIPTGFSISKLKN